MREIVDLNSKRGVEWQAIHGDCIPVVAQLEDHRVGFAIYSIPFLDVFAYSESEADLGNTTSEKQFFDQYSYLIKSLNHKLKPGRLVAVHVSDIPYVKWKVGYSGINTFSEKVCRAHQDQGQIVHSKVTIWKCPVVEMTRTHALGLLYAQLQKDSTKSRQGMADYLYVFRVPGENAEPVEQCPKNFPVEKWQQWASPVWMDIKQTDTLNVKQAKEDKDEKHCCPLQLGLIERAIIMWSNPGDVVLSPFMGIGSEGYVALKQKRKFFGVELKEAYFNVACKNLANAEANAVDLFDECA